MTMLVTRLYRSARDAEAAKAALVAYGFAPRDVTILAGGLANPGAAAKAAGVHMKAREAYAPRIAAGASLLVMRAPFGTYNEAREIVDAYDPVDAGLAKPDVFVRAREPRLMAKRPSQTGLLGDVRFFDFLPDRARGPIFGFMPAILRGGLFAFIPDLTRFRFSSLIPGPVLLTGARKSKLITGNTTPFSRALGLPLLVDSKTW